MYLVLDTYYTESKAKTVGVLFKTWQDEQPHQIIQSELENPEAYEPGSFYKRELPCILDLLKQVDLTSLTTIIIDGYVFLDDQLKPGLGAHLYAALNQQIPVIGVAKTAFYQLSGTAIEVCRGVSKKPLYITSIGIPVETAAVQIEQMAGNFRLPTLLKTVDSYSRIL